MKSNYQTSLIEKRLDVAIKKRWPHMMRERVVTALKDELQMEIEAASPGEFRDGYRRGLARALVIAMRESKRELWNEGSELMGIGRKGKGVA